MDTVGCKSCYFIESEIIHTRKERLEDFHVFQHDGFRGPTAPLSVFRGCGDWADVMNKGPMSVFERLLPGQIRRVLQWEL